MDIKAIVFDLDGTLVKSDKNIYKAILGAFTELDIKAEFSLEEFTQYIGWHFKDIFPDLSIDVPNLQEFIELYKQHYYKLLHHSKLYPAVEDVLEKIYAKNIKIALLTTKAQDQADFIIDHFELRKYFSLVMGRRPNIEHKPSPEPLQIIGKELGAEPDEIIMVGDSEMDIRCGKNAGSHTVAVEFGYRTKEHLQREEPDYLISSLTDLLNIIERI